MRQEGNITTMEILVNKIKPILANNNLNVQGAVLADLFAIYLVGHIKDVRAKVLSLWLEVVRDLVAIYEDENPPKKNSEKN